MFAIPVLGPSKHDKVNTRIGFQRESNAFDYGYDTGKQHSALTMLGSMGSLQACIKKGDIDKALEFIEYNMDRATKEIVKRVKEKKITKEQVDEWYRKL